MATANKKALVQLKTRRSRFVDSKKNLHVGLDPFVIDQDERFVKAKKAGIFKVLNNDYQEPKKSGSNSDNSGSGSD